MKKTSLFLLLIGAALAISGCSKDKETPSYSIAVTADEGGTATATIDGADATEATKGTTVTLTAMPSPGYEFTGWTATGVTITDNTDNPATFIMPAGEVSIKAEFGIAIYAITITDDTHGTATATVDDVEVTESEAGTTITLTATPASGYVFGQWTVTTGDDIEFTPDANTPTVTFTMPTGEVSIKAEFTDRVTINGITWAVCNVDAFRTFTASPTDYGMFYQWNRKKAWATANAGDDWDSTSATGDAWESDNDPCPAGWRLPTKEEQAKLFDADKVSNEWTTIDDVAGCIFTDNASGSTVFFPAAGYLYNPGGLIDLMGKYGYYWSSSPGNPAPSAPKGGAWGQSFNISGASQSSYADRAYGFNVRCVIDK
ncbi:hypothetical protein LJC45_02440 [Alistipes sp. OttesenSCG-928-B03]|nr:hypothetical protein [Alistipes sp. OttesenSCG-928-B03]